MKAIVAVYHNPHDADWGIGANGTQPLVLSADRKFFRQTTNGAPVIVGYTTFLDFPNQRPLPNRTNYIITRKNIQIDGATIVHSTQDLLSHDLQNAFVIGGASIYSQLLPYCDEIYVTHIYQNIYPDVFFPNLSLLPNWESVELESGEESGISYTIKKYMKKE